MIFYIMLPFFAGYSPFYINPSADPSDSRNQYISGIRVIHFFQHFFNLFFGVE